jgi:retron-type reverse transcriptase
MTELTTLDIWRQTWDFDDLRWREPEQSWFDRRAKEREQRKRERSKRDRRAFGEDLWGVSKTHLDSRSREDDLKQADLPLLRSEQELAKWLDIPLTRLRWYTHDKAAETVWHYVKYTIPKRNGGQRVILAPKTELKDLQRKVLHHILKNVASGDSAHGFVTGRSIVTNAQPHVGKQFVLNLDLKDFFPTVTFPRVRGLFIGLGYSFTVASALALLCTEYDRELFETNDTKYWVSVGSRALVQGAPTSPALANLAARRLDARLNGLARKHGFAYTRYADDLTFSGDSLDSTLRILDVAQRIIAAEGFAVNTKKTRILRRSTQQSVTGIVVNDRLNVPRSLRRQLRAILYNAQTNGLDAQNRDGRDDFCAYLQGMIGFINEANPEQAQKLSQALKRVTKP